MVFPTMTLKDKQRLILSLLDIRTDIPINVFYRMLLKVLSEDRTAREALSAALKAKYHL